MTVRFEWDEGKDRANIVKHGAWSMAKSVCMQSAM
jgi:uncharacterized DUF497 family protein